MTVLETAIKIAANSISELRVSDVFRVLEQNSASIRAELAEFIANSRPDLAAEVLEVMEEEFA